MVDLFRIEEPSSGQQFVKGGAIRNRFAVTTYILEVGSKYCFSEFRAGFAIT